METMIGYLEGTVHSVRDSWCLVLVSGLGYKVFTTKDTLAHMAPASPIALWTHQAVREDALDLFGFLEEQELRFFELLLSVSGIGPKSALGILDIATVETLQSAIIAGNASYLTTVSGIGKKTAEKIVLELKDKLGKDTPVGAAFASDADALEAMRSLGYSAHEAREALRGVSPDVTESTARLREALRLIGSR
jgi:Holliday junction DNA helicase RuvA